MNGINFDISRSNDLEYLKSRYIDSIILKEGLFVYVKIEKKNEICPLYCSALYENDFTELEIKNRRITIGSGLNNQIIYNCPLIDDKQVSIYYVNNSFFIETFPNIKSPVYVNDNRIDGKNKILSNGDRIWLMGLNIIYNNNRLFINNPFNKVTIKKECFNFTTQKKIMPKRFFNNKYTKYFIRPPRRINLERTNIEINPPSLNPEQKGVSALTRMGAGIGMVLMSLVSVSQSIYNYRSGQTKLPRFIFSLLASSTMLISSIFLPTIIQKVQRKAERKKERKKQEEYKEYIANIRKKIKGIHYKYRNELNYVYPTNEQCVSIIIRKSARLWERRIIDSDFLTVRLGRGTARSNIDVDYKELENNNNNILIDLMNECVNEAENIENVPICVSLKDKNVFSLVAKQEKDQLFIIQNILLQLITFHDYNELKLVCLFSNNNNKKKNYIKMFPHIWNSKKEIRFWADSSEQFNEISTYLMKEFSKRSNKGNSFVEEEIYYPYYLIIVDDYKSVESLPIVDAILKSEKNRGFSILFLSDRVEMLPNACKNILLINNEEAKLIELSENKTKEHEFNTDIRNQIFFGELLKYITNTAIKSEISEDDENLLPESLSFMEMYGTNRIEDLNIWERWNHNDTTISLAAAIGVDNTGNIINLDIHEKYHGPHGLIAGSTGSGKSEFIITYILSLIINYHPDDVNFILIDYKGGGLANAFERANMKIPHLVGTITNIDKSGLQRSLESLQSELKRRQIEFNNAKEITGESTIDIYKFQKYYHAGKLKKNISHLFIISDEFAELKQQEPEVMDEIISIARIGRSLGVHLILATQKPSGVVNDQIRSNTKFGICLKVQSPSDSQDIIGEKSAANLKRAGQFYFKVGNDDYLVLGQSGWAGAEYKPNIEIGSNNKSYVEFISNTGMVLKRVENISTDNTEKLGDQITNIVKYICDLAKEKGIHEDELWLENMPEKIYINELRKKYKINVPKIGVEVVAGEYDDPSKQNQNAFIINYTDSGNTIIYGNSESGKETLVGTMVYDLMTHYSPEDINIYIMDFGMEALKIFYDSPHVGDVILQNDNEKISRLLLMLTNEIKERKKILLKYGGNYKLFLQQQKNKMPLILIIINNYDSFLELYENVYGEAIQSIIRDGLNLGIIFNIVTSSTSSIRYRMQQNFKHKIALKMTKDSDYSMIFDKVGKKRASNLFGRGLIELNKKIYEYQIPIICDAENWNNEIMDTIEELKHKYTSRAREIDTIPEILTIDRVKNKIKGINGLPIGLRNSNLEVVLYNFQTKLINIVSTKRLENTENFIINLVEEIRMIKDVKCFVIDAEIIVTNEEQDVGKKYIEIFQELDKLPEQKVIIIIVGISKFISRLGSEDILLGSLEEIKSKYKNVNLIVFEEFKKMNEFKSSKWFKQFASEEDGIWIGPGFTEQYLLKADNIERQKNVTLSFGYVVKKGEASYIKILGMSDRKGDSENE